MEGNLSEFLPLHSKPVILVKNQTGLKNLYKLVSWSHLENMIEGKPYITKDKLSELRDGLIIGSKNETGELFRAVSDGKTDAVFFEIAGFYDYLEIFPSMPRKVVSKIVCLEWELNIPVCATGNVYFAYWEQGIFRHIILNDEPCFMGQVFAAELPD